MLTDELIKALSLSDEQAERSSRTQTGNEWTGS